LVLNVLDFSKKAKGNCEDNWHTCNLYNPLFGKFQFHPAVIFFARHHTHEEPADFNDILPAADGVFLDDLIPESNGIGAEESFCVPDRQACRDNLAGVDFYGIFTLDNQAVQVDVRQDTRDKEHCQHDCEDKIEQVLSGVDCSQPDQQGQQDENEPLNGDSVFSLQEIGPHRAELFVMH
jgi:hypothetical protein